MNELAKKWIADLRSGRYKQGRGELKTSDGKYCCLGVAAEGVLGHVAVLQNDCRVFNGSYVGLVIADRVRLGITREITEHCINLNDTHGKTFVEIADYLEGILV